MSKIYKPFLSSQESHDHSLKTLRLLYEFDDFMSSIGTMIDMGCGDGLDLEWWATRTTRDLNNPIPLNISCTGVDIKESLAMAHQYKNIRYQPVDFEKPIPTGRRKFDVIWSHDSFQYVIDPFTTLRQWRDCCADNGMLILIVPQTTNLEFNSQAYDQRDKVYWHWTMVNLIHVLSVTGWDCRSGFFLKQSGDPWLHAAVYKSKIEPMDPRTVTWYELSDMKLLPESADKSIAAHGYLRQRDLLLQWIDRSNVWMGNH